MTGGPPPAGNPPIFNAPPATIGLCASLVVGYLITDLLDLGGGWGSIFVFDVTAFRGQFGAAGTGLSPAIMVSLLGHGFMHAGLGHLAANTLFLLAFATPVERTLGAGRLIAMFIASIVAGALALAWLSGGEHALLVGASGGVYGISGAAALILRARGNEAARRTGTGLLVFLVVISVVLALTDGASGLFQFRIAWQAHLGGLAVGLAVTGWALARARR